MVKMPSFFWVVLYPEQLENGQQAPSPVKQEQSESILLLWPLKKGKGLPDLMILNKVLLLNVFCTTSRDAALLQITPCCMQPNVVSHNSLQVPNEPRNCDLWLHLGLRGPKIDILALCESQKRIHT